MSQNYTSGLYSDFPLYKDKTVTSRRFGHDKIEEIISSLKKNKDVTVKTAGSSAEGRNIYLISVGTGPVNVFSWSQMHGDESTATMALFDIFNFLTATDDKFDEFRKNLLSKVTLHFAPMINPDGAERFQRRNALEIDLNRDAASLQMPESKVLAGLRDSLKPEFGFNLHDQSTYYTAGRSRSSAMLSFLAPAYNYEKDMNETRKKTMQLIGMLSKELNKFIPGHIGRYNDDYEPRAFGEYMMRNGTASTLVESGGWKNDEEKQFIRRMNFVTLLTAYHAISERLYEGYSTDVYWSIPENERILFDLVVRNVNIEHKGNKYTVDLGIKRNEINTPDFRDKYYEGEIEEIGDMSVFHGYNEVDCSGMEVIKGKVFPDKFETLDDIRKADLKSILLQGYTAVKCDEKPDKRFVDLPVNIVNDTSDTNDKVLKLNSPADLCIYNDEKLRYIIVNGFLYDINSDSINVNNAINYIK